MKLYMKQQVFSWGDKFSIYDENGNEVYYVEGEVFTFGKKLHLFNPYDEEVAYIAQEIMHLMPKFFVYRDGEIAAEVNKKFSLVPKYDIIGPGWYAEGSFLQHEFTIMANDGPVAVVEKEWFTFGDAYAIEIDEDHDPELALCVVLIIDAVMAMQAQANSSNN